jgi:hypothetical protein
MNAMTGISSLSSRLGAFRPICWVLALFFTLCLPATSHAQSAPSVPSGSNAETHYVTVYQVLVEGNWEIYRFIDLVNSHEWNEVRITNHPANDTQPQVNLATTDILFVSDRDGQRELYLMPTTGVNVNRLTFTPDQQEQDPAWSRDGKSIIYAADVNGRLQIFHRNLSGIQVTQLTNTTNVHNAMPTWSPNGDRIAWVRIEGDVRQLWIMNADGSQAKAVTDPLLNLRNPAWSPSGTEIAMDYDADADSFNEGAVLNLESSVLQMVYDPSYLIPADEEGEVDRVVPWDITMGGWSPDGTTLVGINSYYQDGIIGNGQLPLLGNIEIIRYGTHSYPSPAPSPAVRFAPDLGPYDLWPPEVQLSGEEWLRLPFIMLIADLTDRGVGRGYVRLQRSLDGGEWIDYNETFFGFGRSPLRRKEKILFWPTVKAATIAFRAKGIDDWGHEEEWPEAHEFTMRTYDYQQLGKAVDNRGNPLAYTPLTLTSPPVAPVTTTSIGEYRAYYYKRTPDPGTIDASIAAPSYFLDTTYVDDWRLEVRESTENLIANGSFEAELADWQVTGQLPIISQQSGLPTTTVYHGSQAAVMGAADCLLACWQMLVSGQEFQDTYYQIRGPWVDDFGNLHLFYMQRSESQLWHYFYPKGQLPATITSVVNNQTVWRRYAAWGDSYAGVFNADGDLIVVWTELPDQVSSAGNLWSRVRRANGQWTAPVEIGPGLLASLTLDSSGTVHLLARHVEPSTNESPDLRYYQRQLDESWTKEVEVLPILPHDLGAEDPRVVMAVDDEGDIHLVGGADKELYYLTSKDSFQGWVPIENSIALGQPITLLIDDQGDFHLFTKFYNVFHLIRPRNGQWGPPQVVASHAGEFHWQEISMAMDANHGIYLGAVSSTSLTRRSTQRYFHPTLGWQQRVHGGFIPLRLAIGKDGRAYGWYDPTYPEEYAPGLYAGQMATQTQQVALHQKIDMPVGLHEPTLSWLYRVDTMATQGDSHFAVSLDNGITATVVFSATSRTPWNLAWVDMTPWAGQSVTVTLATYQVADEPLLRVAVDDVALASWTTPRLTHVAYDGTGITTSTMIQIYGVNLMPDAEVWLGDQKAEGVTWINSSTLEAKIPINLRPGHYSIRVVNPGGLESELPHALSLGYKLQMPLLMD